ncbi:hypothetical protein GP475_08935 [Corynebacterium poyangense]|uniref:Uncharacterized protein n=1 Tax=Corynebacterium poyangense TaxID=2684405 RepID=A0A7H0SQC6_9CORY|nr:hypothetical protein [Corynebacterium poyangense]QNQ90751.1 hypothetical protein GP475_08935 [Corynebacterium poyangense]
MNPEIVEAREKYLAEHPFDPKRNAVLGYGEDGLPAGFLTLPDMDELSIVAMKFGYEFLAHIRTDEDVDEWLDAVMSATKSPELAGILFAHAFRGIAGILYNIIDKPGLNGVMEKVAIDGWKKEF